MTYDQMTRDTDGDGLEDGYEIWDFKTLWNTETADSTEENPVYELDSDGDGFPDSYEVFTLGTDPAVANPKDDNGNDMDSDGDGLSDKEEYLKGTDPWLKDSDFDNVTDYYDGTPRQTNNYTRQTVASASQVHKGLYDREYSEESEGAVITYITNIYRGEVKSVYYDYGDANINKKMKYFYDADGNNTAVIEEYDDEYYEINGFNNSQTICITYTYKNGNVVFICDQNTKYSMEYGADGEMTDLSVGNQKLVSYSDTELVNNAPDSDDSGIETGGIINQNENVTTYGNGQTVKTVTTVKKVAENDTESAATIVDTYYGDDGSAAYSTWYNSEGNVIKFIDNISETEYDYTYSDTGAKVTRKDGFTKEITKTEDEENNKITTFTKYSFKDISGNEKSYTSAVISHADEDESTNTVAVDTELYNDDEIRYSHDIENDRTENVLYSKLYKKNILKTTTTENSSTETAYDIDIYAEDKNIEYTYDLAGNITQIKINGDVAYAYTYDAHGRLTTEKDYISGTGGKYGYDETGNIQSKKTGPLNESGNIITSEMVTKSASYGNVQWPDQMTAFGGETVTYDGSGNPINYINGMTFTWERGRSLSKIELEDEKEISFRYNENGLRIYKETDRTKTEYTWDENVLIREQITYKATGKKYDIWYFYDSMGNVAGYEYSYVGDEGGKETNRIYYEKNLQGDVIGLLDSRGAEIATYAYDAWGNVVSDVYYEGYKTAHDLNHITYRSYYRDGETGFYYLQSRYYDPEICRFINADETDDITDTLTVFGYELYCYCEGNPVLYADYDGKSVKAQMKSATYSYNRGNARKYMENNYKETAWNFLYRRSNNGEFYHYSSDCANYVSQCLFSGGFKMSAHWYSCYSKYLTWYGKVEKEFYVSETWRLQNKQRDFFRQKYGRTYLTINKNTNLKKVIKLYNIRKGDILYFNNEGKEYSHAAIIYAASDDTIKYSAHTKSYLNKNIRAYFNENPKATVMVITLKDNGKVM